MLRTFVTSMTRQEEDKRVVQGAAHSDALRELAVIKETNITASQKNDGLTEKKRFEEEQQIDFY